MIRTVLIGLGMDIVTRAMCLKIVRRVAMYAKQQLLQQLRQQLQQRLQQQLQPHQQLQKIQQLFQYLDF